MERQTERGTVWTIEELTLDQKKDAYFHEAGTEVQMSRSEFYIDRKELLVRTSKIDGWLLKVVPDLLREHIIYAKIFPSISRHAGKRRKYDTMQIKFFWSAMANDVHQTVVTVQHVCVFWKQ